MMRFEHHLPCFSYAQMMKQFEFALQNSEASNDRELKSFHSSSHTIDLSIKNMAHLQRLAFSETKDSMALKKNGKKLTQKQSELAPQERNSMNSFWKMTLITFSFFGFGSFQLDLSISKPDGMREGCLNLSHFRNARK